MLEESKTCFMKAKSYFLIFPSLNNNNEVSKQMSKEKQKIIVLNNRLNVVKNKK